MTWTGRLIPGKCWNVVFNISCRLITANKASSNASRIDISFDQHLDLNPIRRSLTMLLQDPLSLLLR